MVKGFIVYIGFALFSLWLYIVNAPLVQARGYPDSGCRYSLHPGWSCPSTSISYNMWQHHTICQYCSMYSVVGATSVRSLPELPQHGVSHRRAGGPGRRRVFQYGVSRRLCFSTESLRHLSPYNVPLGCTMSCRRFRGPVGTHSVVYIFRYHPQGTSYIKGSVTRTLGSDLNCQFSWRLPRTESGGSEALNPLHLRSLHPASLAASARRRAVWIRT